MSTREPSELVARYLSRIGQPASVGEGSPSEILLAALHTAHMYAVPFENLDIRRRVPIDSNVDAYLDKIVNRRRGGFCYELNTAFAALLSGLGFRTQLWSAQVHDDRGWGIEFDHMVVAVDLGTPWLADVGFGDSFVEPLRLRHGLEQPQSTGVYRLDFSTPHWTLMRRPANGGGFDPQFRFTTTPYGLDDFAPGLAYHQSPKSHFTKRTVCSIATPTGRKTLRANRVIVTEDGQRRDLPIESVAEWHRALQAHFGIQLPDPDFSP